MSDQSFIIRVLAVGLAVSAGIAVAVAAGFLSWLGGANPPNAVMRSAAAFAGTVGVAILIMANLHVL